MSVAQDASFLIHEPAEDYHRQSEFYLSSHQLADFRKSPLLYHRKRQNLVPDVDRPAYMVGRAAHTLILEGLDRFDAEYAVGGPVNPRTGHVYGQNTKAWAEWAQQQGKQVLTDAQFEMISNMNTAVHTQALAINLMCQGEPEGVVRADYGGMPCQIRMDWFDSHQGIVDLKTCDDLTWFEADSRRYGYVYQLAFYRAVLAQVIGVAMPVHIIAVEKKEPFRCGVWKIDADAVTEAQRENEAAIRRLKQCLADEKWPTGYEEMRVFDQL